GLLAERGGAEDEASTARAIRSNLQLLRSHEDERPRRLPVTYSRSHTHAEPTFTLSLVLETRLINHMIAKRRPYQRLHATSEDGWMPKDDDIREIGVQFSAFDSIRVVDVLCSSRRRVTLLDLDRVDERRLLLEHDLTSEGQ